MGKYKDRESLDAETELCGQPAGPEPRPDAGRTDNSEGNQDSPGDSPLHCLQDEAMSTHGPDVRQLIGSFKVSHSSGSGMAVSGCIR